MEVNNILSSAWNALFCRGMVGDMLEIHTEQALEALKAKFWGNSWCGLVRGTL